MDAVGVQVGGKPPTYYVSGSADILVCVMSSAGQLSGRPRSVVAHGIRDAMKRVPPIPSPASACVGATLSHSDS